MNYIVNKFLAYQLKTKFFIFWLAIFSSSVFAQLSSETESIRLVFETYLAAYKKSDFNLLQKSTLPSFVDQQGGEKSLRRTLQAIGPRYSKAYLEKVNIKNQSNSELWAQPIFAEPREVSNVWYLLKKDSFGAWKIHSLHNDLGAEHVSKKPTSTK